MARAVFVCRLACLCLVLASPLPCLALSARSFEIHRATSKIHVDGVLDEQAWRDALTYDVPYEWQPGDNTRPPVATEALVTYDDANVYIAFRAHDPKPQEIRAHLMDRDSIDTFVQDDHVLLMIDTFNDQRRAFQFRINPLGVQADALNSPNEGIEDWSFDLIWASAGRITADGYVVEIAIPLNQIRFPRSTAVQTWGVDVERSYPRSVRHRMSASPHDRSNNCQLCQIDKVTGFENLKPGRNLELDPTVTAARTDLATGPGGRLESGDTKVDPGLSVRWGITPNISLNAAVNPDFSQVEADAAQLDVNERFALFFPEKRPFFLEGLDVFSTPVLAVFTRTVADPRWGLKLTGKEGKNSFGVFVAEDDRNNLTFPSNQRTDFGSIEDTVRDGVVRYKRDLGVGSSLGVLFTGRQGEGYHNRLAGLDGFFRMGPTDTLSVQVLRTDTLYPAATAHDFRQPFDAFQGDGLFARYVHLSRDWFWFASYEDEDPEVRADSGFVPRVDIRDARGEIQRQYWGDQDDWYTQANFGFWAGQLNDHSGRRTDQRLRLYGNVSGPLQSFLEVGLVKSAVLSDALGQTRRHDDLRTIEIFANMQPSGLARFTLTSFIGDMVDFTNNRTADGVQVSPGAELKIGRHVNAKIDHSYQRLDENGGRLFEANLSQLRLIYNFNTRSFVRGIFQYLDLKRDLDLYDPIVRPFFNAKTETLFTQLLFSYKLNPQTVLFLGYSDDRLGTQSLDLSQTDRTFFFKVGYALVL
jgi:hypothetical protein